jgi:hypothetical protein
MDENARCGDPVRRRAAPPGTVQCMPSAPTLTAQQRSSALVQARVARTVRVGVQADLKAGRLSLARLFELAATDECVAAMRVTVLLASLPGYGSARAAALLAETKIAESRRVRGLGANQRAALLARVQTAESTS